jgi:hypothetical protein
MSDQEFDIEATSGPENGNTGDFEADGSGHMLTWRAPELETEGGGADDVVHVDQETGGKVDPETGAPVVEQITMDAWWVVFQASFAAPMMFGVDFEPVAIQPEEQTSARAASDAAYRLLQVYYPRALIAGSDKLTDLLVAGGFIYGKVMIVKMILQARRAEALEAVNERKRGDGAPGGEFRSQRTGSPGNDNYAPPPGAASPMAWADGEAAA